MILYFYFFFLKIFFIFANRLPQQEFDFTGIFSSQLTYNVPRAFFSLINVSFKLLKGPFRLLLFLKTF